MVVVAGSTGKLATQILAGAPFDVFLAADQARPELLVARKAAVADSRFTYATGALVLWSRDALPLTGTALETLDAARISRLAMANPKLAPYGLAAQQTLDRLGLLKTLASRIVYGENIGQTFAMAASGNVTAALIAKSQLASLPDDQRGHWIDVPDILHEPILQDGVLTMRAKDNTVGTIVLELHAVRQGGQGRQPVRLWSVPPVTAEVFDAIWLTAQLATISVVLLLILATPVAWWLAFTQSRMKIPIEALTTLPLVLPPTVLGFYLLILLGPAGWLGGWWVSLTGETLTFSFTGLVVASMIHSLPFVVQPMRQAFQDMGTGPLEDAATLGAGPLDRFFSVGLPQAQTRHRDGIRTGFCPRVGGVRGCVDGRRQYPGPHERLYPLQSMKAWRRLTMQLRTCCRRGCCYCHLRCWSGFLP